MPVLSEQIIRFYKTLNPPASLPPGVKILFPQQNPEVLQVVKSFFKKFYTDDHPRHLIFGINPGRFGAGTTGINFTAPRQLKENCGIDHSFPDQTELSAEFIYEIIERYGGVRQFYRDWIISAVCPLGFVSGVPSFGGAGVGRSRGIKNLNYYDDKQLQQVVTPFIIDCINKQLKWNVSRDHCFCIGEEKNFNFLSGLNKEYNWFGNIIPLPHPRFIMQYRRKQKKQYIGQYLSALRLAR